MRDGGPGPAGRTVLAMSTDTTPLSSTSWRRAGAIRSVNPTTWSQSYGYDQGQVRTARRILTVAGQGPLDAQGRLLHEGDLAAQMALALHNVVEVVEAAGLRVQDIAQLRIFVLDVEAALANYSAITEFLADHDARPPATVVEVSRLAVPGMGVEIEALAIA